MREFKQPEGYPRSFQFGTKKTRRGFTAYLARPMNRYNVWMSVGHGWQRKYSHTDPAGASVWVSGAFEDGRLSVTFHGGGFGSLSKADIVWGEDFGNLSKQEVQFFLDLPTITSLLDENGDHAVNRRHTNHE